MLTARQIYEQTGFRRDEAERLHVAIDGKTALEISFWAMVKSGHYTVDEIVERLGALKGLLK